MLKYCKCICDEYTYVICAYRYKMMKRFFLPHIGILKSFQRKRRLTIFFLLYVFSSSLVNVSVTKRNGFSGMKNQSRLNIYWKNECLEFEWKGIRCEDWGKKDLVTQFPLCHNPYKFCISDTFVYAVLYFGAVWKNLPLILSLVA